jgi:hypothetical protein
MRAVKTCCCCPDADAEKTETVPLAAVPETARIERDVPMGIPANAGRGTAAAIALRNRAARLASKFSRGGEQPAAPKLSQSRDLPSWPKLSKPFADLADHYPVLIVGSGYGGGVHASRLARAGQQVGVREKGKEMWPGEYPETLGDFIGGTQRRRILYSESTLLTRPFPPRAQARRSSARRGARRWGGATR